MIRIQNFALSARNWLEPAALLCLTYLAWGIGDRNRMMLSRLDKGDLADIVISLLLVVAGFYLYKIGYTRALAFGQHRGKSTLVLVLKVYIATFLLYTISNKIAFRQWWDPGFLYYTTPLFVLLSVLILAFLHLQIEPIREPLASSIVENPAPNKMMTAWHLGKEVVPLTDIVLLVTKDKTTYLLLQNGQEKWLDGPLRDWEARLPVDDFFRINRQCIAARHFIKGYTNLEHQKLLVLWSDALTFEMPEIVVSKITAPLFKKWLATSTI